jgi:hypothetical protein
VVSPVDAEEPLPKKLVLRLEVIKTEDSAAEDAVVVVDVEEAAVEDAMLVRRKIGSLSPNSAAWLKTRRSTPLKRSSSSLCPSRSPKSLTTSWVRNSKMRS